ncbi:MAG: autoinducer binding domain-containing protein [Paracoccus sp. (in: a-proteobacteria)]|nr:autoinducer binding domain-containing protein [Paracoccus sp. (in: a-proteobacteria)]
MPNRSHIASELARLDRLAPQGYFMGLHIRFAAPVVQFDTYAREWREHYEQNAYALRDPIIAWGFSASGASRWSDLPVPDPFGILTEAAAFGLRYGVAVSAGPLKSRSIGGTARDDREFTDSEIEQISDIIGRLHELTEPPESLTKAQIEALRCIAAGDRHAAAAASLGITESAFKARLISVRERLNARTTAEALQKAKDYRLL